VAYFSLRRTFLKEMRERNRELFNPILISLRKKEQTNDIEKKRKDNFIQFLKTKGAWNKLYPSQANQASLSTHTHTTFTPVAR
jgi:hypothetical protein